MLLKQTKIVATISDQRCEVDFIRQLFEAGMNVVRMNTAHLNREGAEKLINNVRTVSNRIGILMDTKGPEVRTTPLTGDPITFKTGDRDFYRAQSEFVAQLAAFAHNNQVHVHLVAHPRKTDRIDDSDAVAGIGDVTNLADNVFTMEKEDREDSARDSILTVLKNRFWGERGRSIGLCFEKRSKRFYKSGTGNPNKAFGWALAAPQGTIRLPEDEMEQDPFETDRKDAGI